MGNKALLEEEEERASEEANPPEAAEMEEVAPLLAPDAFGKLFQVTHPLRPLTEAAAHTEGARCGGVVNLKRRNPLHSALVSIRLFSGRWFSGPLVPPHPHGKRGVRGSSLDNELLKLRLLEAVQLGGYMRAVPVAPAALTALSHLRGCASRCRRRRRCTTFSFCSRARRRQRRRDASSRPPP